MRAKHRVVALVMVNILVCFPSFSGELEKEKNSQPPLASESIHTINYAFPPGYKLPPGVVRLPDTVGRSSLNKKKSLPAPLALGFKRPPDFDRRLDAIVRDPQLLWKLDQRRVFSIDEFYGTTLERAQAASGHLLPYVFCAENTNKLITALCIADKKVFFWLPEEDRDLVGWIPLISRGLCDVPKEEWDIVVWSILKKNSDSSAAGIIEPIYGNNIKKVQETLRTIFPEDIVPNTFNQRVDAVDVRTTFKWKRVQYAFVSQSTNQILQTRISIVPVERKGRRLYSNTCYSGGILNMIYSTLPSFWPPTEEKE